MKAIGARVRYLEQHLRSCLRKFDRDGGFSGPSVHFHERTMDLRRRLGCRRAIESDEFCECLYATLTSWGMHRMGKTSAKLLDWREFCANIRAHARSIARLQELDICSLPNADVKEVGAKLDALIQTLGVSEARTKLVSGSKTLHHLLPGLVPPIDREYTLRFFYGTKSPTRLDRRFPELFAGFTELARRQRSLLEGRITGLGFHTSLTKEMDNAIVGARLLEKDFDGAVKALPKPSRRKRTN